MVPVSRVAREIFMREPSPERYTPAILKRLRAERPDYAYLANFLACKAKTELGERGFKLAQEIIAVFYRVIELSEHYPDSRGFPIGQQSDDILAYATTEELARSLAKATAAMEKMMKPHGD